MLQYRDWDVPAYLQNKTSVSLDTQKYMRSSTHSARSNNSQCLPPVPGHSPAQTCMLTRASYKTCDARCSTKEPTISARSNEPVPLCPAHLAPGGQAATGRAVARQSQLLHHAMLLPPPLMLQRHAAATSADAAALLQRHLRCAAVFESNAQSRLRQSCLEQTGIWKVVVTTTVLSPPDANW